MKKQICPLILIAFLTFGTIAPVVFADGALTFPRFEAVGRISIVSSGVGLNGDASGTISIDVPGTSVIAAYLYWGGHDAGASGGNNQVTFDVTSITADNSYTDWWYGNEYNYIYVAEVTTLVTTGLAHYNVGDFGPLVKNYGAGLIVVYRDETLPLSKVTILEGLDSFWFNYLNPQGPNSEVTYFDFTKTKENRNADITLIVGGTEHDNRPNEIWIETGAAGTKPEPNPPDPATLVNPPSDVGQPYPLTGADGNAWDTFTKTIEIPEGHEWLGVQIESIANYEDPNPTEPPPHPYYGRGTSGVLIAAGFVLPVEANGKVTGGGQIKVDPYGKRDVGSFGFNAMWFSRDDGPKGELQYLNHKTGDLVHAHIVDYLIVWEPLEGNKPMPLQKAYFYGPCTVNHEEGYWFELYVEDDGEPKNPDHFDISVYSDADFETLVFRDVNNLLHGNIQIHKPPK